MFGQSSYLVSIIIFAGFAILLEWIFGFHFLKKYIKPILITIGINLLLVPTEGIALLWNNWKYNPLTTFDIKIFGAEAETFIYMIFVATAVASAVIAWTYYEDKHKNILRESIHDILKGTFAIWKKQIQK